MLYLRSKKYLISVKNAATKEELMVAHVLKAMEFAVNVNKLIYKFYNKKDIISQILTQVKIVTIYLIKILNQKSHV